MARCFGPTKIIGDCHRLNRLFILQSPRHKVSKASSDKGSNMKKIFSIVVLLSALSAPAIADDEVQKIDLLCHPLDGNSHTYFNATYQGTLSAVPEVLNDGSVKIGNGFGILAEQAVTCVADSSGGVIAHSSTQVDGGPSFMSCTDPQHAVKVIVYHYNQ